MALAVTNTGGHGGLLASTSTGVVTNETWKCSDTEQAGWHLAEFDDTSWDNAYVVGQHNDGPWGVIIGISGTPPGESAMRGVDTTISYPPWRMRRKS